jgi:hypothetical protein
MTAPPITPGASRSATHRHTHHAVVAAAVAVLIAAGGYTAAGTFTQDQRSPESRAASSDYVTPGDTVMSELRKSVIGQYGPRQHAPAAAPYVRPSENVMRDLHESMAGQYGSAR